jgi:hypothetical protein
MVEESRTTNLMQTPALFTDTPFVLSRRTARVLRYDDRDRARVQYRLRDLGPAHFGQSAYRTNIDILRFFHEEQTHDECNRRNDHWIPQP